MARTQASVGQNGQAVTMLREALARADLQTWWRARILSLLALLYPADTGDLKAAESAARQALGLAAEPGDAFVTARALIACLGLAPPQDAAHYSIDQGVIYLFAGNGLTRHG